MTVDNAWTCVPVTYKQYYKFRRDFHNGMYPHERFGQAFYNVFLGGNPWSVLFHATDNDVASELIVNAIENYGKKDDQ